MKHDPFEQKLAVLAKTARPVDSTVGWKADILATAVSEAGLPLGETYVSTASRPPRPIVPRWLLAGWLAAWVCIAWMRFTTPSDGRASTPDALAAQKPDGSLPSAWDEQPGHTLPLTLLAFHREMNTQLETP